MPASSSSRLSIAARRWRERRTSTLRRWSSHCCSASPSETTLGVTPSTSTFMLTEMRVSSSVSLNSDSISVAGSTARLLGSSTMRTSSVDSSRTSASSGSFALVEEIGDLLDQPRLLHAVGDLGDDRDPAAAARILLRPARAQPEGAAAGAVGLDDRGPVVDDDAAGREVRARHEGGERLGVGVGMGDEIERRVAELGDVVRRNRGRHADRDALRAVGEQVRHGRRHDDRLFRVAGVIVAPVDRVFVDALHQEARDIGHARFGVAVGGGVVAVDVAEIALPLDQRIARGEVLRETHQRLVDRLVAVRMERAHHVADDLRAFLEGRAGVEPEDVHAVEDAAMHGLQPVARVGQRAAHDGRERIGEIALLERVAQVDVDRRRRRRRGRRDGFGHALRVTPGAELRQARGRSTADARGGPPPASTPHASAASTAHGPVIASSGTFRGSSHWSAASGRSKLARKELHEIAPHRCCSTLRHSGGRPHDQDALRSPVRGPAIGGAAISCGEA